MPKRQPKARERPHRIPNPQIWDAAEQYYQACVILEEQQLDERTLLPLLHSGAIALELYLKCLGAKDRYQKVEDTLIQDLERVHAEACPTHRLSKLLKEISVDTRNRLIAAFESSPHRRQTSSFEELLGRYEHLLAASRYPFEEKHQIERYSPETLLGLIHFLRDAANHEYAYHL